MATPILLLHSSAGGYGADLQLYALATQLDPARFTPLVVVPEPGPLAERLAAAGIAVHHAPLAALRRRLLRGGDAAKTVRLLARNRHELGVLAREWGVAVVHSNTSILLAGQAVADRAGVPHIVHVREIFRGTGGWRGELLWPLYRRHLERADILACVSVAVARQFKRSANARVLYDGVARMVTLPPRADCRCELQIAPDRFVVAVTGRVSDWKGQHVLLRALAQPPLEEIGAIGLIAGDAAPGQERYERILVDLARRFDLGDRVRFVGFRDDIGTILGAADVVAVPSVFHDPLPQAAIEAAVVGVPVVVTDRGGLPEIIHDGRTGRVVPAGDPVVLADALRELADDPQQTRRLGRAALADISARFSSERMVHEVEACYERLIA
jgi:glycosyltransferase involved in cell wall biosynthesis